MNTPNIFDYATSELSQDAFLCWLIACAGCHQPFQKLGKDFIRFLYNPASANEMKVQQVELVENEECPYPWTQYKKIDVYFQAIVDNKKVSFIIEDKTGTQMHSNQLKRYAEDIQKDEISEDEVKRFISKQDIFILKRRKKPNAKDIR